MSDDANVKISREAEEKEPSRKTDEEQNPKRHGSEVHSSEPASEDGDRNSDER